MKDNLKKQFLNLKAVIKNNVDTLKGLVDQSEQLSTLIDKMSDTDHSETIQCLKNTREQIDSSIEALVNQTHDLFKVYDKLVDEIFPQS